MESTDHPAPQRIAGLTKEEFTEKNAQHAGRLKILSMAGVDVIVRPLTRAEYDRFVQDGAKARQRGDSLSPLYANTVRSALIAPDTATFDHDLNRLPALAEGFVEELLKLAGVTEKVEEKAFL